MPIPDAEFIQRLRSTFKVEADEHVQAISTALLELEKSAAPAPADVEKIYREAHTLKGAARAVDFSDVEAVCQALEDVFSAWKRQEIVPPPEAFDSLHAAMDSIRSMLDPASGAAPRGSDELLYRLRGLQNAAPTAAKKSPPAITAPAVAPSAIVPVAPEADLSKTARTVRIAGDKLDAHLLQAEDLLSVKSVTVQRAVELREMTRRFEEWERQWSKVASDLRKRAPANVASPENSAGAQSEFLDWNRNYVRSIESRLTALALRAEQDRHHIGKRVDDLLEGSKKLLMLPFSTLAGSLPKVVRDLCRDQKKEAELIIKGGEVEIDKRILEEMKDALMHIVRNCVDHGVELPAERERLGKSPRAIVSITVTPVEVNKVEICVSDDGAGVNVLQLKRSAVRNKILSDADASAMNDSDALALAFHSDVSTSPIVTAISGRGLGMAIVRGKVEQLGGRVLIESTRNAGTSLRIILPLTLATFRGILVASAGRTFLVPTANVERVARIRKSEVRTVENREVITMADRPVSLARLDAVLSLPRKSNFTEQPTIPVLLLQSGDQRIAFAVDEVLREEEVLVKPLRAPISRMRNIAGATVLGSGNVVPVLNVSDLIKSARSAGAPIETVSAATTPAAEKRAQPRKRILVVEDSITSRMLLKGILESAGFNVKTAVDGMEGFAALREEAFDLVVSDVEMPRMNGFDLTAKIRGDDRVKDLPVVLVTALESREQRERGIDAGANAYVIKSSFDQSNLLDVVGRLI